jgi:CRISPR/Cas system CSM-associated protein Csm2 small subunit
MDDLEAASLTALKRHIAARRQEIAEKFPKRLPRSEYQRTCGRHEELESLAQVLQDVIRKANSADKGPPDDDPDE